MTINTTMNHPNIGNHICGLFYNLNHQRIYLPQVQLKSHTRISPFCFTTALTQTFHNPNDETLSQVRYTFPLYDGVAVNGYKISYASNVLKGVVKQKDDAKQTYDAAVARGETAGLLESLPAGVFGVTLGNVPAKTDIVVEITYCGELKHDAAIDGLRYMLPTSIAPRYGNYPGQLLNTNTSAKDGISITVDLDMASSAIRKVQSPSHPISVSMGAVSTNQAAPGVSPFVPSQASATLTLGTTELADDFVLQLLIDDINKPQAILETHPTIPNQRAIMTTLVPKFALDAAHPEIVFIADQSGSMGGSKNTSLVAALKVFLKSLPLGVRFNICAFGSNFKFLWPKSQAYNEDNVNLAMSWVNSFTANFGGTEILNPIKAAFEQHLSDLPLEVMLLTDGETWAENEIFSYVNEQIHDKRVDARVFALGIGGDVSHTLVEGVARAGNGFAQFVTQNEDTDQKIIRMLKAALYAHTKDYEIEVHYDQENGAEMSDDDDFEIVEKVTECLKIADKTDATKTEQGGKAKSFFDSSAEVDKPIVSRSEKVDRYAHLPAIETPKLLQAPNEIPPLFPFNRTSVYVMLGPDSAHKKVSSITLRAKSAQGPLELNVPIQYSDSTDVTTIHQLAAQKAVQDLEEGRGWLQAAKTADGTGAKTKHESRFDEIVERECVRLGEKFQVVGKWTSFVAVQDGTGEKMEVEAQEVAARKVGGNEAYAMNFAANPAVGMAWSNSSARITGFQQGFQPQACMFAPGEASDVMMQSAAPASNLRHAQQRYVGPSHPSPFAASSGGLFGGSSASNVSSGGLFGNQNKPVSGCGLFGNTSNTAGPSSGGLFGQPPAASAGGLFGGSTAGFGAPASSGQSSLFGGFGAASPFGAPAPSSNIATTSTPSSSLFTASPQGQGFGAPSLTTSDSFSSRFNPFSGQCHSGRDRQEDRTQPTDHQNAGEEHSLTKNEAAAKKKQSDTRALNLTAQSNRAPSNTYSDAYAPAGQAAAANDQMAEACAFEAHDDDMGFGLFDDGPAVPPPATQAVQAMHSLISLQTFSGAWAWTPQLFALLGISETKITNPAELGPDAATALAVAFLETKVAAKKDVWEMVVTKARAWLAKQIGGGPGEVDKVVQIAAAYLVE